MTHTSTCLYHYRDAIRSLIDQSFIDWELIFVSNSPQTVDDVQRLAREYGLRVKASCDFFSETRSERFRKAVGKAEGVTCCILDSDDLLHPHALKTVDWALSKNPLQGYFQTSHQEFDNEGNLGEVNVASAYANTLDMLCAGFRQRHFWGFPNKPKEWIPEMLKSHYICEDYFIFSHLSRRSIPILPIPNVCYQYRRHSLQLTVQRHEEIHRMVESLKHANSLSAKAKGRGFAVAQLMQAAKLTALSQAMYSPA